MATPENPPQQSQLAQMGMELLKQALPLILSAVSLAGLVFAVGAAVSVARFHGAGLPWEQAVNAAAETDIRTAGVMWLLVFGTLGVVAVLVAYVSSPQGRATPAMYYALIAIATVEVLAIYYLGEGDDGTGFDERDLAALGVIFIAAIGAALVVFILHQQAHRELDRIKAATPRQRYPWRTFPSPASARPSDEPKEERQTGPDLRLILSAVAGAAVALICVIALLAISPGDSDNLSSTWIWILAPAAAVVAGAFVFLMARGGVPVLSHETRRAEQKEDDIVIALPLWAVGLLGLLSVGAGIALGILIGEFWVAFASTLAGVFGLLSIRVAEFTEGFSWFGVAVFFALILFGAVAGVIRMVDDPRLQPVAFLMKDGERVTGAEGVYVGESDDRLWFASVALDDCGGDQLRSDSGRLRSVPTKAVASMSVGPQMEVEHLAREARAMLDALMAERAGREALAGPVAVRDAVALHTFGPTRSKSGRWVRIAEDNLGKRPTLMLGQRRLKVRRSEHDGAEWEARVPRAATSGPVYADCGERTNPAFLTVQRRPYAVLTATFIGDGKWRLESRGSLDRDGHVVSYAWDPEGSRPEGRTTIVTASGGRSRVVELEVTDHDGLHDKRKVRLVRGISRTLASDLVFRFDRRRLTPAGARRVRALRHEAAGRRGARPKVIIRVHTDERGSVAHNRSLSRARARAVARVLSGRPKPRRAWVVRGLGESRPQWAGFRHRLNRRIEIVIRRPPRGDGSRSAAR